MKRIAVGLLILSGAVAAILVWASHHRHSYYKNLVRESDQIISCAKQLEPTEIDAQEADRLDWLLERLANTNELAKVTVSRQGDVRDVYYLRGIAIRTLERRDEGGRVVRRDISANGLTRVQLFYDRNGQLQHRYFISEDGRVIDSKSFYMPFGGPYTGY